ncbi:hypothetical protein [Pontiella agarivorans]|uniref:Uncharacterized protein n=1 Tax=Pontiella agarivorans TaxID=3038953 RepID=A0ABU5MVX4_9BACT|nr:hypothetical protein [Pontiella agarivorans]MDZ8118370.1 hypothetical protein [Pontiella agarivorans]
MRITAMKRVYTILLVAAAVTSTGFRGLKPLSDRVFPPLDLLICEKPMAGFQSLKTPIIEKKRISAPATVHFASEPESVKQPVRPVQPLEERTDDMLFEADALSFLPFDDAVVRPFE